MRYTYHNDLGHGGFAKVGRYFDNINNCFVALKIYDPVQAVLDHVDDVSLKRRFVREVNYQSAMNNPNVVSIIDSFLQSDPPFFSMLSLPM